MAQFSVPAYPSVLATHVLAFSGSGVLDGSTRFRLAFPPDSLRLRLPSVLVICVPACTLLR